MEIFTIGFTKRSAAEFFGALRSAGIKRLLDVRLHNTSQLAGYAKQDNLRFFLRELCRADYLPEPLLAPTDELLDRYRKKQMSWAEYEERFLALLAERNIEDQLDPALLEAPTVLLCSERTAERCHRRLVLEYLTGKWGEFSVTHL